MSAPPAASSRQTAQSHTAAIGLMCAAVSLFAFLDATAKYLVSVKGLPVIEVVWLRFVVNALLTFAIVSPMALPRLIRTARPGHQALRSLFMLGATVFNFAAVKYLQLDQTVTIFFLTPLLVAALAGPLLGEWVGWRRLLAILSGFLGVLLVTRPGFGGIHWAVTFSFCATLSYALYNISTRYLAGHDPTEVTLFYSPAAGLILTMPFALLGWVWPADLLSWVLLASLGILGGAGHWLLILAHRTAPAPVLSPFVYVGLVWMTLLGYLMFGDVPSPWTLAGGAIVILSGLYLLYRERSKAT
ncbi:MAG: DMT family transporter [Pseudomonadota bacterium]|nr:DMT family transporter [Pseudomonadota bacterium]